MLGFIIACKATMACGSKVYTIDDVKIHSDEREGYSIGLTCPISASAHFSWEYGVPALARLTYSPHTAVLQHQLEEYWIE